MQYQTAGTPAEYSKARDQVMHNAYARAIVDAIFLATEDMQPSIEMSGLEQARAALAQLRQDIGAAGRFAEWAERGIAALKTAIRDHEETCKEFKLNPPMHRDTNQRLVVTEHSVSRVNAMLQTARQNLKARQNMAAHWKSQREQMLLIEPRLAAAITHYISTRQPASASAPLVPAPVVNVTVEMPDNFRIAAMPERVTTSRIERDKDGNIVRAEQIERDAA